MNRPLKAFALALMLCTVACGSALAQPRIAVVRFQKVLDSYYKTKQANAVLQEKMAEMEKLGKDKIDTWKKAKEDYQKLADSATDQAASAAEQDKRKKAAADKFRDIKAMEDDIASFRQDVTTRLGEMKTRLRKTLLEDIQQVIKIKAEAGGYALVIDADAQTFVPDPLAPFSSPTFLYYGNKDDLTDAVVAQLNAAAPVDISKDDAKPEPKPEAKDTKGGKDKK